MDLAKLFTVDSLDSHTYADGSRSRFREPEKTLMLGILEDAIATLQNFVAREDAGTVRDHRLVKDAIGWIRETGTDWIFSFESCCLHLDLTASYLRQGLAEPIQRAVHKLNTTTPRPTTNNY